MNKRDYNRVIAGIEASNGLMIDYVKWSLITIGFILAIILGDDWLKIEFIIIGIVHYVSIWCSSKTCHLYLDKEYEKSDGYESYIAPLNIIVNMAIGLSYLIISYRY